MARTSGTRKGNGPGWGGPAKGAGNQAAGPGRGNTHRSVADLMAADDARQVAADAWMKILRDPTHPQHAAMVEKAALRMDGAPVQQIEVEDRRAVVSSEPLTEDEWIAAHGVASAGGAAEGSR